MTDEPHEYPKPEYVQQFAESPSEAYDRGVQAGIDWLANEASRRRDPEGYKMLVANNRLRNKLTEAMSEVARLKAEHAYCNYRDDMGR